MNREKVKSAARCEWAYSQHVAGKTVAEIGDAMGISATRAQQLINKQRRVLASNGQGMTREQAIEWYKEVQSGVFGSERMDYLEKFEVGEVAKMLWNNPDFTYGIEYGALIAIAKIFDLSPDDV